MDEDHIAQLEETLARDLPLSKAMELRVADWDGHNLAMQMPLEPNKNHQFSAFGGSLSALCTMVGWGTLFLMLAKEKLPGNIVIRRGNIRYHRPVVSPTIVARGIPVAADELAYFFELMRSKGRSKLDLASEIVDDEGALVSFKGSYVVLDE